MSRRPWSDLLPAVPPAVRAASPAPRRFLLRDTSGALIAEFTTEAERLEFARRMASGLLDRGRGRAVLFTRAKGW